MYGLCKLSAAFLVLLCYTAYATTQRAWTSVFTEKRHHEILKSLNSICSTVWTAKELPSGSSVNCLILSSCEYNEEHHKNQDFLIQVQTAFDTKNLLLFEPEPESNSDLISAQILHSRSASQKFYENNSYFAICQRNFASIHSNFLRQLETTENSVSQIEDYLKTNICLVTEIGSWILGILIVISIFNSLGSQEINGVYFFIRFLQSNNLLAYINYSFPSNFVCFYDSLDLFNFQQFISIPNLIRRIFTSEGFVSQDPPTILKEFSLSANWFENGGKAITPLILILILWIIVKILLIIKFGTEVFPVMMKQIADAIVWNGVIRVLQVTFLPLLFSALLQFTNIDFSTTTNILGFAFAILTCLILFIFLICSVRLARSPNLKDQAYQKKFGATYNDYYLDKEVDYFTINFEVIVAFKKSLQLLAIVYLGSIPTLQIIIFVATECFQSLLLFSKRRFKDKTSGIMINFMSMVNFLNSLVIAAVFLLTSEGSEGENILWIIIILSGVLYLINILLMLSEQMVKRGEIFEFYAQVFYGLWVVILGIFSCFCCVCIAGRRWYWSRKDKKTEKKREGNELALI